MRNGPTVSSFADSLVTAARFGCGGHLANRISKVASCLGYSFGYSGVRASRPTRVSGCRSRRFSQVPNSVRLKSGTLVMTTNRLTPSLRYGCRIRPDCPWRRPRTRVRRCPGRPRRSTSSVQILLASAAPSTNLFQMSAYRATRRSTRFDAFGDHGRRHRRPAFSTVPCGSTASTIEPFSPPARIAAAAPPRSPDGPTFNTSRSSREASRRPLSRPAVLILVVGARTTVVDGPDGRSRSPCRRPVQ
jgi:hypothetical protein